MNTILILKIIAGGMLFSIASVIIVFLLTYIFYWFVGDVRTEED